MRVGIYNRYLATLGGGEQYMLAIAEALSARYPVEVLSHLPVDRGRIAGRLGRTLAGVTLRTIPEQPAHELGAVSAAYDLFINASHQDFIPPRARHNALVVYFPVPPPTSVGARLRRGLGHLIRRWSGLPAWRAGAYSLQTIQGAAVRGLTQQATATLPRSFRPYRVAFALANARPLPCRVVVTVDGQAQMEQRLPPYSPDRLDLTPCTIEVPAGGSGSAQVTVSVVEPASSGDAGEEGPWLYATPLAPQHNRFRVYQALFEQRFRELGVRLQNPLPLNLREIVAGYELIWSISRFTETWVQRYWGQSSQLLYPPVEVERFVAGEKRRQLISVGRYFAGQHNKKHEVMVRAFREMVDGGLRDWELHLAGGTMPGALHQDYLDRLRQAAQGYPIVIHTDLARDQLARLYGESAIYWHAAGYGESEEREPIKFEHFGITTVEAMAAGCVPVVIGKGGQKELIDHGHDGFLWYTSEELAQHTLALMRDEALRRTMAERAHAKSRQFDRGHFEARLAETLAACGIGPEHL